VQVLVTRPRPRILFTTGDDLVSRSVQIFTGSRISHAAVVLPSSDGKSDEVIHAVGAGVVREPRQVLYDKRNYRDVAELVVIPPVDVASVVSRIGQPYDYPEIVSRVLLRGFQAVCPWLPEGVSSSLRRSCARLVLDLDPNGIFIPEWHGVKRASVTPVELANRVGRSFQRLG
jgi:hypothetical protein